MKKISIVLALALVLVFAFAVNAMAEQQLTTPGTTTAPADKAAGISGYNATAGNPATGNMFQGPAFDGALNNTTRIHSNYQLNSNACAACHAVHTGVGAYLLQWENGQATCEACHDGTSKTYDVFNGQIAQTGKMTYGGRFDAYQSTHGSIHNVEGVDGTQTTLSGAPGGNRATPTAIADASDFVKSTQKAGTTGDAAMSWGATFECLSCHDPHGKAGNGRILTPNPNNYANANAVLTTTQSAAVLYPVTNGNNKTMAAKDADNQWVYMIDGYPFNISVYDSTGAKMAVGTDYTTNNANGYTQIVFTTAPTVAPKATYYPGVKVNMTVSSYLQANETVTYQQGINTFCGACHVDYNTEASTRKVNSTDNAKAVYTVADGAARTTPADWKVMVGGGAYKILTGTYHAAYRHSVGFTGHSEVDAEYGVKFEQRPAFKQDGTATTVGVFNCLSCHVAHGADEKVWTGSTNQGATDGTGGLKAQIGNGYAGYNGAEVDSRGSALTRMPNRGVCQTCHNMQAGNQGMAY